MKNQILIMEQTFEQFQRELNRHKEMGYQVDESSVINPDATKPKESQVYCATVFKI